MYSKKVMDHFLNPRNKGRLKNADAVGRVGNPICGDVMHIYIKVRDGRIEDIGWETMGCAAAIATSSMLSELAKGKSIEEALNNLKEATELYLEEFPLKKNEPHLTVFKKWSHVILIKENESDKQDVGSFA